VRVLIVDDSPAWRRTVSSVLQEHLDVIIVCESSDGVDAVQKSEELQPDLILLDIGLPHLNGLEAARQIRKVAPTSKLLFLTSYVDLDLLREALVIGALGYVAKSDAAFELVPAVNTVMRGEWFVSSRLSAIDPNNPLLP
jgi:DNA-binding NarL/FixJ family response regulator